MRQLQLFVWGLAAEFFGERERRLGEQELTARWEHRASVSKVCLLVKE
jgi:hypothetical protein